MKSFVATLTATAALAAGLASPPAAAHVDVGVSVGISQPGVYGRIDIGRFPQPQVIVQQPVWVVPAPVYARPEPVYLWVPPGHRKNWRQHCGRYDACGAPVYFVSDRWYHANVAPPPYRKAKGRDRWDDRDDDRWHDDDRGRGHRKHKKDD